MKISYSVMVLALSTYVVFSLNAMSQEKGKKPLENPVHDRIYKAIVHTMHVRNNEAYLEKTLSGFFASPKEHEAFDVNCVDNEGKTLLHHGIDDYAFVKWLLEVAKANPNIQDKKYHTPLHYAAKARYCNPEIVKLLLEHGAQTDIKACKKCTSPGGGEQKETPLVFAQNMLIVCKHYEKNVSPEIIKKRQEIYDILCKADKNDGKCGYFVENGHISYLKS